VRPAVPPLTVVHTSPSPAAAPGVSRLWDPESLPRMLYVPGNHDIGVGATTVRHATERYIRHIGPLNFAVDIAGVRIVAVDTLGIGVTKGAPLQPACSLPGTPVLPSYGRSGTVLRGPPALESSPAYQELDRAFSRMRAAHGSCWRPSHG